MLGGMKLIIVRPLVFFAAMALVACSSSNDNTSSSGGSSGTSSGGSSSSSSSSSGSSGSTASIDGKYTGRYEGDATGAVEMTVGNGKVDVIANVAGTNYPGTGNVNENGDVTAGVLADQGVTVSFSGKLADGKGVGTWSSSLGTKGSWSVSK